MIAPRSAGIILAVCIAVLLWYVHDTLLLVFAGALAALVLRAAAEWLARHARIPAVWGVWLTVFVVVAIFALSIALLGTGAAAQVTQLREALPPALQRTAEELRNTPFGLWIADNVPNLPALIPDTSHLLMRATGILSGALGAVVCVLIVIFVGITGALEPELYTNGFIALFPANYRARLRGVLVEIGATLRTWLLARLLTMTVTALLVTVGLAVLHVPLAFALGILAGLLAFIPNIGAFAAALPAVVLAFVVSPKLALAVSAMYVIVHILDDFIVGPFVERQVVKLPPILTLVAQVVFGIGAGAIGIMLAAPIVATLIVIVRRLWVEDVADPAFTEVLSDSRNRERSC